MERILANERSGNGFELVRKKEKKLPIKERKEAGVSELLKRRKRRC